MAGRSPRCKGGRWTLKESTGIEGMAAQKANQKYRGTTPERICRNRLQSQHKGGEEKEALVTQAAGAGIYPQRKDWKLIALPTPCKEGGVTSNLTLRKVLEPGTTPDRP